MGAGHNINLLVTAASVGQRYSYLGSFPDYKSSNGASEPNGDLGYLYQYNGGMVSATSPQRYGGMNYTLQFFDGDQGNGFETPFTLSNFRLLIYDVDGEATQTESVRAYVGEGLSGYQLPKNNTISVDSSEDSVLFTGPGADEPEDNPRGMFILHFSNTSSITLSMESHTQGNSSNGVFSVIDGDLSILGGNTDAFEEIVHIAEPPSVPEPSAIVFASFGLLALGRRQRRA